MTSATISNWQFEVGTNASPQVLTAIEEVFSVSGVGKTNELIDVTNFDSPTGTKEYIAGLADGDEITVEANYIPAATHQPVVMTAVDNGDTRLCKLRYTAVSPEKNVGVFRCLHRLYGCAVADRTEHHPVHVQDQRQHHARMSYLKTDSVFVDAIGETIEIVELNALGQREMINAHSSGDMFAATAVVVKYGTRKWADKTPEDILAELPLDALQAIAEKVTDMSGLDDEKNSESNLSGDSSTA